MFARQTWMRRALLAAFLFFPVSSLADITVRVDETTGAIVVTGLSTQKISAALTEADALRLRVANSPSSRSMLVSLSKDRGTLIVSPRFALKANTVYELTVAGETLPVHLPSPVMSTPQLVGFAPSQAVIPANTLRLYLHFSEPMARGQLRDMVSLSTADGTLLSSPFLSLKPELWDPSQTRATLLLDPGRIKQGVGPNLESGAPLQQGQSYCLSVSPEMLSAAGSPLGQIAKVAFRVGPPERRAIEPENWDVLQPAPGSHAPFTVVFDRLMDSGAATRLITLYDPNGQRIQGQITSDGGGWSLVPVRPWEAGLYRLRVDPEIEDVAGNNIGAPFDASPGTIGNKATPVILTVYIPSP